MSKISKENNSNVIILKPRKHPTKKRKRLFQSRMGSIQLQKKDIEWESVSDKVSIIRKGIPCESIEVISAKANMPVKQLLSYLNLPQTTYNKKKRSNELLSLRDSEILLDLSELLDYGLEVFNDEKIKFHTWLKSPNIALGNITPESLFDSFTGIEEVKRALNRIEYGNFA
jgi:putative toxin-antitoxin system antitoxin component (TIGR02293 family)